MRILVILMIVWVSYWAATGGLDRIVIPEDQPTTSIASYLWPT